MLIVNSSWALALILSVSLFAVSAKAALGLAVNHQCGHGDYYEHHHNQRR